MNSIVDIIKDWRPQNWLVEKNHALIAKWIMLPLVILIAWIASQLFWLVLEAASSPTISTDISSFSNSSVQNKKDDAIDIQRLVSTHLFGKIEATAAVEQVEAKTEINEDAPETRLPLVLRGIYSSTDDKLSNAIIENSRKEQNLYFINDSLPEATNLKLAKVLIDRVILSRSGKFETLKMEEEETSSISTIGETIKSPKLSSNADKKGRMIDKRKNDQLTGKLTNLHSQIMQDPESLAGMMNALPVIEDGEIKGFKISPGKDPGLFTQAGLRRNDVVTNVNGIELNSISNGMALKEELKTATEISVQLTRGSQQISLVYSLNENNK